MFSFNFNINELFLNFHCFPSIFKRRKKLKEISLKILDYKDDYNYQIDINNTLFFIIDKNNIVIQTTDFIIYDLNKKQIKYFVLEKVFPTYIYNFYKSLIDEALQTKSEIRTRAEINKIVYDIICLPLTTDSNDFSIIILHLPFTNIQKMSKIKHKILIVDATNEDYNKYVEKQKLIRPITKVENDELKLYYMPIEKTD